MATMNDFLSNQTTVNLDEKPDVDYADIGGLDLQKQEIREAVELPLTHFGRSIRETTIHEDIFRIVLLIELYKLIGIDPPRGVLMYGPPGLLIKIRRYVHFVYIFL